MASSRISRNLFWSGLWIYSLATGLASMIFMAWAFYVETTGRGALFIEPNRVLAAGGPSAAAPGGQAGFFLFFPPLPPPPRLLLYRFFLLKNPPPPPHFFLRFPLEVGLVRTV